ncbi:MAG: hypothetical protein GPJ17_22285, partial [Microcystis aeruginosa K13-07]|nr:hypothetical protein [Microcystis aeruginosa K13-07]
MITGELKSKIDKLWTTFWNNGIIDTPRSKETGILGSQRLLAKDRIASEKVEVFSPQAFIG